MKWFGCLLSIIGIILVIFVLTHLTEIWKYLEGLLPK
jgi:hypothetical protein